MGTGRRPGSVDRRSSGLVASRARAGRSRFVARPDSNAASQLLGNIFLVRKSQGAPVSGIFAPRLPEELSGSVKSGTLYVGAAPRKLRCSFPFDFFTWATICCRRLV
jgi:hypothetical protein